MKKEFELKRMDSKEILSAGICDNCLNWEWENTGGGGIPDYPEMICKPKRFILEPLPKDEQVKECEYYKTKEIIG